MQLWFALYGCFALLAWAFTRGEPSRHAIAWALLASWAVGNVAFFTLAPDWRPLLQCLFDIAVMMLAAAANLVRRSVTVRAVQCLALMSFCATFAHAWTGAQIHLWEVTTNILFALQCAILSAKGLADATRRANRNIRRRFGFVGVHHGRSDCHTPLARKTRRP